MTARLGRRGQAAGGERGKGQAAPAAGLLQGWVFSGKCFHCHGALEAWHPRPDRVRHVEDKTPYGECPQAVAARGRA